MSDKTNAAEIDEEVEGQNAADPDETAEADSGDAAEGEGGEQEDLNEGDEGGAEDSSSTSEDTSKNNVPSADERLGAAIARAEDATRRADEAERRLRDRQANETAALSQQEREAKLAKMTPEERLDFKAQEAMARVDFANRQAEFKSNDLSDKAEFLSRISAHPPLLALKDEVENRLTQLRGQGQNVTREVMMKFVLGEKAYQAVTKGIGKKQNTKANENIRRSTTQTANGKGQANGAGRKQESARDRLAGVSF